MGVVNALQEVAVKKLVIFIFCNFLSGCMVYECIDELFPRAPKPIDDEFIVELKYNERDVVKKKMVCEEYYDAICAERGNFWTVREVGREFVYQSSVIEVHDSAIGNIIFPLPLCTELVQIPNIIFGLPKIRIDGIPYGPKHSDGKFHTYQSYPGFSPTVNTVVLNFDLKINGESVDTNLRQQFQELSGRYPH